MQAFCSISLRVITGPAITTIILVPATAQAIGAILANLPGMATGSLPVLPRLQLLRLRAWRLPVRARKAKPQTMSHREAETNGEQSHA